MARRWLTERALCLIAVSILVAPACALFDEAPASSYAPLSLEALRNTEYFEGDSRIRLSDGRHVPPFQAVDRLFVFDRILVEADLNADNQLDAVVLVILHIGASSQLPMIAVMLNDAGSPVYASSITLQDRTIVNSASLEPGALVVDLTLHSQNDPLCCPTQRATQRYPLANGILTQQ
jgi:hypothetical protein